MGIPIVLLDEPLSGLTGVGGLDGAGDVADVASSSSEPASDSVRPSLSATEEEEEMTLFLS